MSDTKVCMVIWDGSSKPAALLVTNVLTYHKGFLGSMEVDLLSQCRKSKLETWWLWVLRLTPLPHLCYFYVLPMK